MAAAEQRAEVVDAQVVDEPPQVEQASAMLATQSQAAPPAVASIDLNDPIQMGRMVVSSKLFPGATTTAQAVAKIMAGRDLGLGPMVALNNIHVVQGRVALSYALIAALIKRSGRYNYRIRKLTPQECELDCYERWDRDKWELVGEAVFTMDDARRAGLLGRGPDSPWTKYPRNMLFARAITNMARTQCADIFVGAIYDREELEPETPDPE